MDFKNELFQGQDAYFNENGCYPDIVFVRYDVWCEMFGPVRIPAEGKGIYVNGDSYVPLRTIIGPMFQFSDREFMNYAFSRIDPYKAQTDRFELIADRPVMRIADWNLNYCTPVAMPVELKTRSISVELMKRWKESF